MQTSPRSSGTALFAAALLLLGLASPVSVAEAAVPERPALAPAGPDLGKLCDRLQRTPARSPLCTHGPDRVPALGVVDEPAPAAAPADLAALCPAGGVTGKRIEVLYGVPQDRANQYAAKLVEMRNVLAQADGNLDSSDPSMSQHYRFLCETGTEVTIRNVTLVPIGADGRFTFTDYVTSLQKQVELGLGPKDYVDADRVYMTFVDQIRGTAYPYGGEGSIFSDDQPDASLNANNGASAKYSMTAQFNANIVGHEIGHNIGAVQNSSPHSSGGFHCHDEYDLMCYSDGGPYFAGGGSITTPCPGWQNDLMDCGKDDYYYPGTPPAGTYLSTHWNTANSGFLTPYEVDTTAPAASRYTPASGATRVNPLNPGVTANFTEAVDGVDATTFTLTAGTTAVAANVSYAPRSRLAEFRPVEGRLAANTTYTATLTGGATAIRDAAGNPLPTTSWSFRTGNDDSISPTVAQRDPADGATAVVQTTKVTAAFNESVVGVGDQTFTLEAGGSAVSATVSYDALLGEATLSPASPLAPSTTYTATLTGGDTAIRDTSDNPLVTTSWSFTTGDATSPTVSSVSPSSGATGTGHTANVTATFSEDVQGVDQTTFTLAAGSTAVSASVSYDASTRVATLTPSTRLDGETTYTATLRGGAAAIRDAVGNPLETTSWSFTTAVDDSTAPTVARRHPATDATGASPTTTVTATFSEAVDGVSDSTFTLAAGATAVPASVSYDASTRVATLSPGTTLAASTAYTATLTGGASAIRDAAGNALATTSWSFTTASPSKTLEYGDPLTLGTPTGPGEQRPTSVATGDVDEDGLRDVLVSSSDGNFGGGGLVSVYLGTAGGSPVHSRDVPTGAVAYGIAVGHLDGDAHLDVVTTRYGGISILHGRGDGTFAAPRLVNAPGDLRQPVIADLDGDGRDDVAAADFYHGSFYGGVTVLLAKADGSFAASSIELGQYTFPQRLAAGDLDDDGHLDLVATNGAFHVMLGNGDGTFGTPVKHEWTYTNFFGQTGFGASLTDAALADFDGDGNVDVAASQSNDSTRTVWFFPGKGDGTFDFSQAVHRSAYEGAVMLTAADVDGDGRSDVVTGGAIGPHNAAVFSTRSGTDPWPTLSYAGSGPYVGSQYTSIAATDLSGDGIAELITIDRTSRLLLIRRSGNPDTDGPSITIASPLDGTTLTYQQQVAASWTCSDLSAITQCVGTLSSAAGSTPISNGQSVGTEAPGSYQLTVAATDIAGNTSNVSVGFTIAQPGDVAAEVRGGETVTTGASATVENPLQTSITVPPLATGGTLTVDAQPSGASPTGFALFGTQLGIEGPVATAADPYQVTFTVDGSQLGGTAPSDVQVLRNGVALTGCTHPDDAVPDPCIVSRGFVPNGGGDAVVVVRTSRFSTWSLGRLTYDVSGPFSPLAAGPTINTAKAGASIPVRFKLGGDRGLDVLATGSPTSTAFTCPSKARTNEVRATGSSTSPLLTYDAASGTYTYMWKTTTAMKGCRDLTLRFRDGSQIKILFKLR